MKNSWSSFLSNIFYIVILIVLIAASFIYFRPYAGTISTFIVGFVAIFLYFKQKHDDKNDAANILYIEIENAARLLDQAKQFCAEKKHLEISDKFITMPEESWSKYKYLFIRDFRPNEWNAITDFYNGCKLYDDAVKINNSYFRKNEELHRIHIQEFSSAIINENYKKILAESNPELRDHLKKKINDEIGQFMGIYTSIAQNYLPMKPVNDGVNFLEGLSSNILLTTIGTKLRNLAGL